MWIYELMSGSLGGLSSGEGVGVQSGLVRVSSRAGSGLCLVLVLQDPTQT